MADSWYRLIGYSYVISVDKNVFQFWIHAMMIDSHEYCINDDAECDEKIHKSIHNEELHPHSKLLPARGTLPTKEQLHALCFGPFLLGHSFAFVKPGEESAFICDKAQKCYMYNVTWPLTSCNVQCYLTPDLLPHTVNQTLQLLNLFLIVVNTLSNLFTYFSLYIKFFPFNVSQ